MILPTKHVKAERALIGVGGEVLGLLTEPMTVSRLWDALRERRSAVSAKAPVDYTWFVLALDFLFMIGAIEAKRGIIERAAP
ncbi:hypothetical protein BCF46_3696 [Litoreibacter meonggei]|uniref:Uncharacterized protein n=2 Tax=Rhodobacterales TaxID=204455 RepID=A0A497VNV4_9RHOB|nr:MULTISPECIES: ABC-three component system middle component 6 [Rhodobacterales]MDU9006501.1 hypothetical protein [Sedimentitalea todarodis]RLJ40624.1 hypothetical protein BCF46_3696 [Litoreibacter meonggei]